MLSLVFVTFYQQLHVAFKTGALIHDVDALIHTVEVVLINCV